MAKNKQKELELLKAKNELKDIENQIISLFVLLKNNYKMPFPATVIKKQKLI